MKKASGRARFLWGIVPLLSFGLCASLLAERVGADRFDLVAGMLLIGAAVSLLLLASEALTLLLGTPPALRSNLRLLVLSSGLLLLGSELFLRFGLGTYATWQERNRTGFYTPRDRMGGSSWFELNPPNLDYEEHKPEFTHRRRSNSLGLFDRETEAAKSAGELRILALGDSFTEGVGAAQDEAWVAVMSRRLDARVPQRRIVGINAGISGSDPCYAYVLLREKLLAFAPDLVIVAVNDSDVTDLIMRGGMERFLSDGSLLPVAGPGWEWLYGTSYLVRHLVHDGLGYDWLLIPRDELPTLQAQAVQKLGEALEAFRALAGEEGFGLLVVLHPMRNELAGGRYTAPLAQLAEAAPPDDPVLDLLAVYREGGALTAGDAYYWPLDGHHTPAGYRAMGLAIAAAIERRGLLEALLARP